MSESNQNIVINISGAGEKKKRSILFELLQFFVWGIVVLGALTLLRAC